jgi:hypothetical protein
MKNLNEVKAEIEKIERDERLNCPKAEKISSPGLVGAQAILVYQLEVLYWVLGENMPDYECQKYNSSLQQSVTNCN